MFGFSFCQNSRASSDPGFLCVARESSTSESKEDNCGPRDMHELYKVAGGIFHTFYTKSQSPLFKCGDSYSVVRFV